MGAGIARADPEDHPQGCRKAPSGSMTGEGSEPGKATSSLHGTAVQRSRPTYALPLHDISQMDGADPPPDVLIALLGAT
jgi:hypothetical protein